MDIIGGLLITFFINILGGAAIGTLVQPLTPTQDVSREEQNIREEQIQAPVQIAPDETAQNETPSAEIR